MSAKPCKMYAYVSSEPSTHYPENTASDFTIQLPQVISGVKECGIIEVKLPTAPKKGLFLCSDLCVGSITNNLTLPVLRRMRQKIVAPNNVTYAPLKVQNFDTIRFYICTESNQQANLAGETRITLHLR